MRAWGSSRVVRARKVDVLFRTGKVKTIGLFAIVRFSFMFYQCFKLNCKVFVLALYF